MCCYRDQKNLDRFSCISQAIIYLAVCQLKEMSEEDPKWEKQKEKSPPDGESQLQTAKQEEKQKEDVDNGVAQERDKLFLLVSKIFLLNFPLYVAFKHLSQAKLDDLSQQEMQSLNLFCDLHDSEIPIYLLRNVSVFCKLGGLHAMTACFTRLSPEALPVSTAHAMISVGKKRPFMPFIP